MARARRAGRGLRAGRLDGRFGEVGISCRRDRHLSLQGRSTRRGNRNGLEGDPTPSLAVFAFASNSIELGLGHDPPLTTCDTADKGRFSIRSPYLANDGSVPYDSDVALSYGAEAVGTASSSFSLTGEAMLSSSGTSLTWCGSSVMIIALRFNALRRCRAFAPQTVRRLTAPSGGPARPPPTMI